MKMRKTGKFDRITEVRTGRASPPLTWDAPYENGAVRWRRSVVTSKALLGTFPSADPRFFVMRTIMKLV